MNPETKTDGCGQEPHLIVMLTYNDLTVPDAAQIFEQSKHARARHWGIKEHSLPLSEMKSLYARMKDHGCETYLEVVAYTEKEGLEGARMACECGCDVLMGTVFADSINDYCHSHGLRYMPFVGKISGRPSVLEGSVDEMVAQAKDYISRGAYGIDLLGYRYRGDAARLNQCLVSSLEAPVCIAGSIDSFRKLDEVRAAKPWAFTIGSAFFDHKFGPTFSGQIDTVCEYIAK